MALKEHENNIVTKQYDDPITNYLRNIIQRYFQIENEISQESKEAIIIQAYTRLKEILNAYSNKYIICINERSGNIDLFIKDLGGEEAFDKNTAFNKDFCNTTTSNATLWNNDTENYLNYGEKQEDHIVAGDDDRLSNARIPLAHIHTIDEIKGLREKLEEYNLINGGFHLHTNQNILNMLIYTGSRVSIDLILIEDLVARVEKSVERFKETDGYFISLAQRYINQLQDIFTPVHNKLRRIEENIDSSISNIVREVNAYTDIKNVSFKKYIHTLLENRLNSEEYNLLKNTLEHSIRIVGSGTIPLTDDTFVCDTIDSVETKTTQGNYHDIIFDIYEGYTKIALSCSFTKQITGDVLQYFAHNDINNGDLQVFLEYTKDGVRYNDLLPKVYQINNSRHDFVYADYYTDSNNQINVYFKRLSYLPVYISRNLIFGAYSIDKSQQTGRNGFLILNNTDTTDKSNDNTIDNTEIQLSDSTAGTFNENNITFSVNAYQDDKSYCTKSKLEWQISNALGYSYKIFKRENDGYWMDLMAPAAFSSNNVYVLQTIYDEGYIYSFYSDGTQTERTTIPNKEDIWKVTSNGYLMSSVNNSNMDALLTNKSYTVYRHRATLTSDSSNNGAIIIIISAVNIDGIIHTLSLVCDKGGEEHVLTGHAGCSLVYDYSYTGQKILGTFSHEGDTSNWNADTKINFDIRKDKENIVIYSSGFYTLAGIDNYDESKTHTTADFTIPLSNIQSQTGVDFSDGMIGYGNFSQQGATIIGIDFEDYNSSISTEYIDEFDDTLQPLAPKITGKCISSNEIEDEYDIIIDYTDCHEQIDYKLYVYDSIDWTVDSPVDAENKQNNPLYTTDAIYITTHSGIDQLIYGVGPLLSPINEPYYTVVSENDIDTYKKHIVLKKKARPSDTELVFCDNVHQDYYNNLKTYLSDFNADLYTVTDSNKDLLNTIALLYESEQPLYHINNSDHEYFIDDVYDLESDLEQFYFGVFPYNSLKDYFNDATINYKLLTVPGKGEDNA